MASVVFKDASRIYPGTTAPAVDKLNLTVNDGEFLVLVGPSGCGKSTSLRMLAGLEEIDNGAIYIGDREVTNVAPNARFGSPEEIANVILFALSKDASFITGADLMVDGALHARYA